jgi:hypothetical protein
MPDENAVPKMPKKKKRKRVARVKPEGPNDILARLALEDRAEKINEKRRKEESRQRSLDQFHLTERTERNRWARFQARCDHLLGTHRIGVNPTQRHCALHKNYYSNKTVRIYCGKCRFEWLPGDKKDRIIRFHGERGMVELRNPSGKSWREINEFFYSFENANDLTTRAFRIERVEPEDVDMIAQEETLALEAMGLDLPPDLAALQKRAS